MKSLFRVLTFILLFLPWASNAEDHTTAGVAVGTAYQIGRLNVGGTSGTFTGFAPELTLSSALASSASSDLRLEVNYSYWSLSNNASSTTVETLKGSVIIPEISFSIYLFYMGAGVRAALLDFSSASSNSTYFGFLPTAEMGLSLNLKSSGIVALPTVRVSQGKLRGSGSTNTSSLTTYELSARIRFTF